MIMILLHRVTGRSPCPCPGLSWPCESGATPSRSAVHRRGEVFAGRWADRRATKGPGTVTVPGRGVVPDHCRRTVRQRSSFLKAEVIRLMPIHPNHGDALE